MKNFQEFSAIRIIILGFTNFFLRANIISKVARDFRTSMLFYIASTIFAIMAVLVVFFEFYKAMIYNGFSYVFSLNIIIVLLILCGLTCLVLAKAYAKRARSLKELKTTEHNRNKPGDLIERVAKSFLKGLFE